jgi:hypothetical protein
MKLKVHLFIFLDQCFSTFFGSRHPLSKALR